MSSTTSHPEISRPAEQLSSTKGKVMQRNLPHNTTYSLVRAYHTGGLENACGCMNCGKPIVHVAEVKDAVGNRFLVGMDCAATLATVNPFEFNNANYLFGEAKKVRAAMGIVKQIGENLRLGPLSGRAPAWLAL